MSPDQGEHPEPHAEQNEGAPPADLPVRPASEPRSLRYHDLAGARPQPAGRVLAIGVLALVLAALLNADGLAELATRQPVGWKRDVARAAVVPFCAVARVTHLRDAREALRDAADKSTTPCNEDSSGSDSFVAPATPSTTPAEGEGPAIAQRSPTAADPLRVWLGGDSMTIELADAVEQAVVERPEISLETRTEVSSGLTRPDFFDWPEHFTDEVLPTDPEAIVVMFGANDSQGMELDGEPVQPSSARWQDEYRRRVAILMDQLRGDGRLVLWVGQPRMRDDGFDRRMGVLDEIYAEEAEARPWVRFLDSRPVLSPSADDFQSAVDGTSLRQGDGIHLDRAGADRLAEAVVAAIEDEVVSGEQSAGDPQGGDPPGGDPPG
ncbi:hypothetical protein BH24ACT4_BH24ACT4_26560 [soil metagenome]